MTQENINLALNKYKKVISKEHIKSFTHALQDAPDKYVSEFLKIPLKSTAATLLFSILFGVLTVFIVTIIPIIMNFNPLIEYPVFRQHIIVFIAPVFIGMIAGINRFYLGNWSNLGDLWIGLFKTLFCVSAVLINTYLTTFYLYLLLTITIFIWCFLDTYHSYKACKNYNYSLLVYCLRHTDENE